MGNRKPQTRIVAHIDGDLRKLLSIRELSDDRLIISIPANVRIFDGFDPSEKRLAVQQKYTVHLSRNSADSGSLIHHTQTLDDGSAVEVHCYTHAFRDFKFQPIFGTTLARLDERWNLESAERDRVINIGSFDQTKGTLVYTVVISQNPQPVAINNTKMFETVRVLFRRFAIDIVIAACFLPTFNQGFIGHMATSTPITPFGPPPPEVDRIPSPGLSNSMLQYWLPAALSNLINLHALHAARMFGDDFVDLFRKAAAQGPISLPRFEHLNQAASKFLGRLGPVLPSINLPD